MIECVVSTMSDSFENDRPKLRPGGGSDYPEWE